MKGAVERVRPKMMTVAAIMAGLLPIMWSHGTGAEVMQRIAVPMIGGMVSSTIAHADRHSGDLCGGEGSRDPITSPDAFFPAIIIEEISMMMHDMMGGMHWGMMLVGVLIVLLLVLAAPARRGAGAG